MDGRVHQRLAKHVLRRGDIVSLCGLLETLRFAQGDMEDVLLECLIDKARLVICFVFRLDTR